MPGPEPAGVVLVGAGPVPAEVLVVAVAVGLVEVRRVVVTAAPGWHW